MTKKNQPHLLLHNLIGAVSYWGTTTRVLLIGFVLGVAVLLHISEAAAVIVTGQYAQAYFYVLASLFLLDAGYVTIARSAPLGRHMLDRLILLLLLTVLSLLAVIPYFVVLSSSLLHQVNTWLFVIVLFVLALRLVIGFLQTPEKKPPK